MTIEREAALLNRPDPPVTFATAEWWEATRSHRLTVQQCRGCDALQLYPRSLCTSCGGTSLHLVDASGQGTVYSVTVIARSPDPTRFAAPYAVALVRLEEGPLLLTNVVGIAPESVACGQLVSVVWEDLPDGRALPLFEPTEKEGS